MQIKQAGINSETGEHSYHVWEGSNLVAQIKHIYEGLSIVCVASLIVPDGPSSNLVHVGEFTGPDRHRQSVEAIRARLAEFAAHNPGLPSDADGLPS